MARAIDSEAAYQFLTDQLVEETGAFSKGVNKGLNIARSAMRNPDAIPALTQPNEWINMEDRPPEFPGFLDHIMVVTCDKNGYVMPMVRERTLVGYEWMERWLFPWDKIYVGPEITHWMPLPKPPKGTEDVAENATTTEHSAWHEWIKERFDAVR